jgi:hypothetical protein
MAGAFGFEKEHYGISMKAGERVLLPRVRQAAPGTLIISNGFSCREQIAQGAKRHTFHLAEILDRGFQSERKRPPGCPRTTTSRGLTHVFNVINEESRLLQQRRCHRSFTAA